MRRVAPRGRLCRPGPRDIDVVNRARIALAQARRAGVVRADRAPRVAVLIDLPAQQCRAHARVDRRVVQPQTVDPLIAQRRQMHRIDLHQADIGRPVAVTMQRARIQPRLVIRNRTQQIGIDAVAPCGVVDAVRVRDAARRYDADRERGGNARDARGVPARACRFGPARAHAPPESSARAAAPSSAATSATVATSASRARSRRMFQRSSSSIASSISSSESIARSSSSRCGGAICASGTPSMPASSVLAAASAAASLRCGPAVIASCRWRSNRSSRCAPRLRSSRFGGPARRSGTSSPRPAAAHRCRAAMRAGRPHHPHHPHHPHRPARTATTVAKHRRRADKGPLAPAAHGSSGADRCCAARARTDASRRCRRARRPM
ncbi:lytic transglycosylase, catalytic domain protein [Burkholderia pseudomallei]|nr:lytic transglycosylase, catalytic domain protein [Burkholderia pseudomallei]